MTELTMWKILSGLLLVIGYLVKALVDSLKKDTKKEQIYICPLDKSGIKGDMVRISRDIEKHETKLNKITSTVDYNKNIIERIDEHYDKITESLLKLVNQGEIQTKLLEKISKNGH